MEIWKDIPGYEGLYQASTMGRIRSLKYRKTQETKVLSEWCDGRGYKKVELKDKAFSVHRLIALTFIPNKYKKSTVNHKNEKKYDNRVENLEWMTNAENHNYGSRNKLVGDKLKKSVSMFNKNGELLCIFESITEATSNGFNHAAISLCCNGKRKSHGNCIWKFNK